MPVAKISGAGIHYDTGGRGPLAVFVHGGLLDGRMWSSLVPLVAARRRWIAVDLRGFGRSGGADGNLEYAHLAADVEHLVEARGGRADLVGLSLGGSVCAELAAGRPDLVRSLCLVSTTSAAVGPQQRAAFTATLDLLHQEGQEAVARRFTERMLGGRGDPPARALVADMAGSTPLVTVEALYRRLADRPASGGLLSGLTVPMLMVHGGLDAQIDGAKMAGLGPVRCIADSGHLIPLERPAELARLLIDFWSAAATPGAQVV